MKGWIEVHRDSIHSFISLRKDVFITWFIHFFPFRMERMMKSIHFNFRSLLHNIYWRKSDMLQLENELFFGTTFFLCCLLSSVLLILWTLEVKSFFYSFTSVAWLLSKWQNVMTLKTHFAIAAWSGKNSFNSHIEKWKRNLVIDSKRSNRYSF